MLHARSLAARLCRSPARDIHLAGAEAKDNTKLRWAAAIGAIPPVTSTAWPGCGRTASQHVAAIPARSAPVHRANARMPPAARPGAS